MPSRIAVIIVNYGTAELAIAAVDSVLARDHGGHPVEIHLLDYASPGGDGALLAEVHAAQGWGSRVRLWQETENLPRLGTEKVDKRALKARYLPVWQAEQKTAG